jgi:hypothetical protein
MGKEYIGSALNLGVFVKTRPMKNKKGGVKAS